MKKHITILFVLLLIVSNAFSANLQASDIDPTDMIEQISIVVVSIVAFLTFIMGSRRVLKFLG